MSLLTDITTNPLDTLRAIFNPVTEEIEVPLAFEVADTTDSDLLQENDTVTIETTFYGTQTGRVARIVDNPFWGMSGLVAYVTPLDTAQGWTAYLTLTGEVV